MAKLKEKFNKSIIYYKINKNAILYFILRNLRIFIIFAEKDLETIRKHAEDFVAKRLAPAVDVSSNGIIYLPEDSWQEKNSNMQ